MTHPTISPERKAQIHEACVREAIRLGRIHRRELRFRMLNLNLQLWVIKIRKLRLQARIALLRLFYI